MPNDVPTENPPDYVNDIPDWYPADWPQGQRCEYAFQNEFGFYGDDNITGCLCGLPTEEGQEYCLFHREGDKTVDALRAKITRAASAAVCLHEARLPGVDLLWINLSGARLCGANLSSANLCHADLSSAILKVADFSGAQLYEADLSGANLHNADLTGAWLYGAKLARAELLRADLSRADMRKADLVGANLRYTNLSGVHLSDASLSGAELQRAELSGTVDLQRANLTGVCLDGATISREADLDGVTWWDEDKRTWWRRWLHITPPMLRDEQEAGNAADIHACERTYRQIKLAYQESGQYDEAGVFFVREMECRRKQLPRWSMMRGVYHVLHFVCDYFESPWRVVGIGAFVILLCAFLQGMIGLRVAPHGGYVLGPGLTWPSWTSVGAALEALYFSTITFTATGYGDYVPAQGWGQAVAAGEALTGVFLMATFLVCLARKFGRA